MDGSKLEGLASDCSKRPLAELPAARQAGLIRACRNAGRRVGPDNVYHPDGEVNEFGPLSIAWRLLAAAWQTAHTQKNLGDRERPAQVLSSFP